MSQLSIVVGLLLVVLGVAGYVASDMVSGTALIPAVFGLVLVALGVYGRDAARRKTAMHLAMGIALVGLFGSARGLFQLPALLGGGDVARPAAVISQAIMAVLMLVYLVMGIRSFISARR
jgi:hypothetical protein